MDTVASGTPRLTSDSSGSARIAGRLDTILASHGFDLVRVRVHGRRVRSVQIMVERPDAAMDAAACGQVSRLIANYPTEVSGLKPTDNLEVSSPGIERPLVRRRDFEAAIGCCVRIVTRMPVDGRRKYNATLTAVGDEGITVVPLQNRAQRRASKFAPATETVPTEGATVSCETADQGAADPLPLCVGFDALESVERQLTGDEFRALLKS